MLVKTILPEDYVNYKKPALFISSSRCDGNCPNCQNQFLKDQTTLNIDNKRLVKLFIDNPLTEAIVLAGLDPFASFEDTLEFYKELRKESPTTTVVIYTGQYPTQLEREINSLVSIGGPLIIKFGDYREGDKPHFDELLGIELASDNQYAEDFTNGVKGVII